MTLKCTCGQPMRFLKSITLQLGNGFQEVVGIECHDEKCKKHRVVTSDVWMASLRELNTGWPDNVVFK